MIKKKFLWLVVLNIVFGAFCFAYFGSSSAYYCGQSESKPSLPLGLSPAWFDRRFQINRGYTSIISSTDRDEPLFDEAVKGTELFKTITAYDIRNSETGLLFKALNWDGVEKMFILREHSPEDGEQYAYEVTAQEGIIADREWINVDLFSCRVGIYKYLAYLLLLLLVIVDVVVILKGLLQSRRSAN